MHSVASAVSLAAIPVTARAQPADQGWRGAAEGAQAAPADLRDADKSSLSTFASMALANRAVQAVAALLGLGDRLPHPGGFGAVEWRPSVQPSVSGGRNIPAPMKVNMGSGRPMSCAASSERSASLRARGRGLNMITFDVLAVASTRFLQPPGRPQGLPSRDRLHTPRQTD